MRLPNNWATSVSELFFFFFAALPSGAAAKAAEPSAAVFTKCLRSIVVGQTGHSLGFRFFMALLMVDPRIAKTRISFGQVNLELSRLSKRTFPVCAVGCNGTLRSPFYSLQGSIKWTKYA
ncbi:MAG: hypothetical protein Ct9H300mP7_1980 [Verrucomicrobiota bacterium]|nr:MAG: hypothetical protein Ct9H300mP7_1980 [Verrucomicrobiota bacterium]